VTEVDQFSPIPLHKQVADILREEISSGRIAPGMPLPSQSTLVQTYGIARGTAARALKILVEDGLAVVSPGRGTYVKPADRRSKD
jgi:GntR family transcriptional regulator